MFWGSKAPHHVRGLHHMCIGEDRMRHDRLLDLVLDEDLLITLKPMRVSGVNTFEHALVAVLQTIIAPVTEDRDKEVLRCFERIHCYHALEVS